MHDIMPNALKFAGGRRRGRLPFARRGRALLAAVLIAVCALGAAAAQPIAIAIRPSTAPPPSPLSLWYTSPATNWLDALPIGNGRLGAMVFGRPDEERIQLNENTLWDGFARATTNPEALKYLPDVRRLLFEGKNADATALVEKLMGRPTRIRPYQSLGDLLLQFDVPFEVTDYRRELDLGQAVARVRYTAGGVSFERELFASAPHRVIVIRLTASQRGQISTRVRLLRSQDALTTTEGFTSTQVVSESRPGVKVIGGVVLGPPHQRLVMRGQIQRRESVTAPNRGLKFGAQLVALHTGGTVRADGDAVTIAGAHAVTLLIAAATSFRDADLDAVIVRDLLRAAREPFEALRAAHVADHRQYFDRVRFELGPDTGAARASASAPSRPAPSGSAASGSAASGSAPSGSTASGTTGSGSTAARGAASGAASPEALPTDRRLAAVRGGKDDPGLVALYFQYGRYLLIGSSRPGQLPANLQGLWNDSMQPPWNADYHTNINLQMNYWPAEVTNLSELHTPLFDYVRSLLVDSGRQTARVHYGARGWVIHHLSDVWGFTTPADGVQGVWPMGAAWLAQHFWEHYAFTRDRRFLQEEAYPVLKGAAEFILDYLVEDPKGRLVTNPSFSPENSFLLPDGSRSRFTYAATMDLQIIQDLFTNTIAAARVLGIEPEFQATLASTLTRLPPPQISAASGRLQEWIEDYREPEPGHRHISHLFAVHPGRQITPRGTPALSAAAHKSLEHRLANQGGQTGWSRAWIVNFFARFEEGDRAYDSLLALLRDNTTSTLLDLHPPAIFQIDGNLAATAGVAEMLLQSHVEDASPTATGERELHLLPALPKAWPSGRVTGLRARGGHTVDIAWSGGRLREATIAAAFDGPIRVRLAGPDTATIVTSDGRTVTSSRPAAASGPTAGTIALETKAGERYVIRVSGAEAPPR